MIGIGREKDPTRDRKRKGTHAKRNQATIRKRKAELSCPPQRRHQNGERNWSKSFAFLGPHLDTTERVGFLEWNLDD